MQKTEMRNPNTTNIDKASTADILKMIQAENVNAVNAVGNAIENITKACDAIAESMKKGGRLIYIGAGTSGRTGVIDAVECPPTFGVDSNTVIGIIAGGYDCMVRASEGEEDNGEAGVGDLKAHSVNGNDVVVGVSAAGNAEYVVKALLYAQSIGCTTVGVTSNFGSLIDKTADIPIVTDTGAEVITGSTRMKAGTAQKLVLNMLSTTAMIKMGYVYENLMINLNAKNKKLMLKKLDTLMDERLLEWNASLYDPEIGGFYFSRSARDNEGFLPDVQSTMQALGFLASAGFPLKDDMPRSVADKISNWAKGLQSPDDGYFYHPQWGSDISENKRGRDLTYALKIVDQYGDGVFPYKTPAERAAEAKNLTEEEKGESTVIYYLQSPEAFTAWCENLWETARNHYSAASTINGAITAIDGAGLMDAAIDFIDSKQDPNTGLWDNAMDYNTIGACYKFTVFYNSERKLKYADKIIENVTNILKTQAPTAIVDVYNGLNAILACVSSFGDDVPQEVKSTLNDNLVELIDITVEQYNKFRKADGGYSYGVNTSQYKALGVDIALGVPEGDMDSPGKVLSARNALYQLAGVEAEKPFTDEMYKKYIDTLVNAPKVEKKKPEPFSLNFEDGEVGSVPSSVSVSGSDENNTANIQKDLSHSKIENKAFKIKSTSNGSTVAYFNFSQLNGNIRAKYKVMVDSAASGNFYCRLGVVDSNNMALYLVAARSGQTFDLMYRTVDSGSGGGGTKIAGKLECDMWYDVMIEYEPAGVSDTIVKYYIDDELVLTTDEYFNNDELTREPVSSIANCAFGGWLATDGSMFIDDFSIESY